MRAIGFVEEPTPRSPFEKDYVLPADVGVEQVLDAHIRWKHLVLLEWASWCGLLHEADGPHEVMGKA